MHRCSNAALTVRNDPLRIVCAGASMIAIDRPDSGNGSFFKGLVWALILVSPFWIVVLWAVLG
jgi:hypothetical protein